MKWLGGLERNSKFDGIENPAVGRYECPPVYEEAQATSYGGIVKRVISDSGMGDWPIREKAAIGSQTVWICPERNSYRAGKIGLEVKPLLRSALLSVKVGGLFAVEGGGSSVRSPCGRRQNLPPFLILNKWLKRVVNFFPVYGAAANRHLARRSAGH